MLANNRLAKQHRHLYLRVPCVSWSSNFCSSSCRPRQGTFQPTIVWKVGNVRLSCKTFAYLLLGRRTPCPSRIGLAVRVIRTIGWSLGWHGTKQKIQHHRRCAARVCAKSTFDLCGVAMNHARMEGPGRKCGLQLEGRRSKLVWFTICWWFPNFCHSRVWKLVISWVRWLKQLDCVGLLLTSWEKKGHYEWGPPRGTNWELEWHEVFHQWNDWVGLFVDRAEIKLWPRICCRSWKFSATYCDSTVRKWFYDGAHPDRIELVARIFIGLQQVQRRGTMDWCWHTLGHTQRRPNTWVTKFEEFAKWKRWDSWQNVALRNPALWKQWMLEFVQFAVSR